MTKNDATAEAPDDWDSDALHTKAQRYIEEMLALQRDDWRFSLWSTLALELLSRAALSRVSPTLLADPKDWNNLYHALGHTPTAKKFAPKSIAISEVLSRLRDILPDFDTELEGFCLLHIGRRNSELHSGEMPFDGVQHSSWLPIFYRSCDVLLKSMATDLAEFLGDEEIKVARKLIAAASDKTAKAVAGTIKAYETVWSEKSKDEQAKLVEQASLWATKHIGHRVECPACKSTAIVTGEPISAPKIAINDDVISETQQYLPSKFECIACGMKIAGLSHLSQAGVGDTYTRTHDYDAVEYYAPEVHITEWEDDNNERY